MQRKSLTLALAIAGAVSLAAAAPGFAQGTAGNTTSQTGGGATQTGTTQAQSSDVTGTPSTRTDSTTSTGSVSRDNAAAAARGQSFDKTGQEVWAETQAKQNNGRISRQAYIDEMSRRWDAMDRNQQGLTPAEVSRLYGNVDSAAGPARTGSGVQAGNMGPGSSKGQ